MGHVLPELETNRLLRSDHDHSTRRVTVLAHFVRTLFPARLFENEGSFANDLALVNHL